MKFLSEVYKKNNELDDIFISKYSSDKEMFKKNKIELLVEIGELANETKCFKYWSKKEPVRELVLEESDYRDKIHLSSSGQRKMADAIEKYLHDFIKCHDGL